MHICMYGMQSIAMITYVPWGIEPIRSDICSVSIATTSPCSTLVGLWLFNSNIRPTASWYIHLLHWGSYKALWNVGLLIRGQSLLYCVNNFKMAVCCGQSMDSLYPESAPPSELSRCVPHLSPDPIRCKGSLSLPVDSHCCVGTELLYWRWR